MRTLEILKLLGAGTSNGSKHSANDRAGCGPRYLPPAIRVGYTSARPGFRLNCRLGTTTMSGRVDSHTLFILPADSITVMLE